jgi:2'-5' RNA ligase
MNWYKLSQTLEIIDSREEGRANSYLDIGHNPDYMYNYKDKDLGVLAPNYAWVLTNGKIDVEEETEDQRGHADVKRWDNILWSKVFSGRYDGSTKSISVVPPNKGVGRFSKIPYSIRSLLSQAFPEATKLHVFGSSKEMLKLAKKQECKGWIAVRLSGYPAKKVKKWGKENISNDMLEKKETKGRETDTHITIIYGVCDESVEEVKEIIKEYKDIKVELGKVGFFKKNPNYDVVIVKIESEDLRRLHEDLVRNLNIKETYPVYKPHCCIAYVKKGEGAQFAGDTFVEGTKLTFKKVVYIDNSDKEIEIKL